METIQSKYHSYQTPGTPCVNSAHIAIPACKCEKPNMQKTMLGCAKYVTSKSADNADSV